MQTVSVRPMNEQNLISLDNGVAGGLEPRPAFFAFEEHHCQNTNYDHWYADHEEHAAADSYRVDVYSQRR